ncbi:MAG TPA: YciI family protein [Rhizomicrobium sp.]|jgi:hypothetical protein
MEYMLVLFSDPKPLAAMKPEEFQAMAGAYYAFTQALQQEKAFVESRRLRPAGDATTVHLENGKSKVQNGPFVETKEELAGYYLIDVPDLDAALKWAARCPTAGHGHVEVRPVWAMPG